MYKETPLKRLLGIVFVFLFLLAACSTQPNDTAVSVEVTSAISIKEVPVISCDTLPGALVDLEVFSHVEEDILWAASVSDGLRLDLHNVYGGMAEKGEVPPTTTSLDRAWVVVQSVQKVKLSGGFDFSMEKANPFIFFFARPLSGAEEPFDSPRRSFLWVPQGEETRLWIIPHHDNLMVAVNWALECSGISRENFEFLGTVFLPGEVYGELAAFQEK